MGNFIAMVYEAGITGLTAIIVQVLSHLGQQIVEKTVILVRSIIHIFSNPANLPAPISEIITRIGETAELTKEQIADELENIARELRNAM